MEKTLIVKNAINEHGKEVMQISNAGFTNIEIIGICEMLKLQSLKVIGMEETITTADSK